MRSFKCYNTHVCIIIIHCNEGMYSDENIKH